MGKVVLQSAYNKSKVALQKTIRGAKIKIGLLILALILPFLPFVSDYILHIVILIFLYMILALGLNIVPGFNGLLDLGYVGFYGIGAYTSGLLTYHFGLSYWLIIPLAFINGAIWGILLGAPTLRLTGDYFAIVTFGFSELVVLFLTNEIWLTRGPLGLPGIDVVSIDLTFFGGPKWEFIGELPYYYLSIVMVLVTVFVMHRVQDSRLGRAWFAIRDDEVAAVSCGINLLAYKVIAFAISAAFGAVGGSFFARWMTFLSPDMFKFWESFLILCMIVLGGMGNIWGVMIGALVLVSMSEVLRELLPLLGLPVKGRFLAFGLIMVLMMRYRPAGILPIQAVAAQMRVGRMKRKKVKVAAVKKNDTNLRNKEAV